MLAASVLKAKASVSTIPHRAHGVVVSHPLRMRKALGSIPSGSINEFWDCLHIMAAGYGLPFCASPDTWLPVVGCYPPAATSYPHAPGYRLPVVTPLPPVIGYRLLPSPRPLLPVTGCYTPAPGYPVTGWLPVVTRYPIAGC